ncbi:invasion associated locus B family protein [Roseobacter ponti]|nr:invasion associated locus B family protein [Roseobacter ponti]
MPRITTLLTAAMISAALTGGTAHAQTTTTESTETETGTEAETGTGTAGANSDLSLGEVETGPQTGEAYVTETIGPWSIRCVKTDTDEDPCQMVQLLEDAQGSPIAEFSLFRLADGGQAEAGATVIVPLETALQQQLSIRVDEQQGKRYPYAFCNPVGCYARIGLTADDVATYKRGNEAVLSIIPVAAQDQRVDVTLSLEGFTASYDKVSSVTPE